MKTTITVREFDDAGNCVKETVTETEMDYSQRPPLSGFGGMIIDNNVCTCGQTSGICPVHSRTFNRPYISA